MNVEELKGVIVSQREAVTDLFKREKIIERDIGISQIRKLIAHPAILALLGVRRCGKSIFSWLLLEGEKFGYINFFDERLTGLNARDLNKTLQAFYELYGDMDYFIFDEIQKIQGWERFASRLRTSKRVVITGSNSDILSGNLATYLTGRHADVELLPFGFKEYLRSTGVTLDVNWAYSTGSIAAIKRALEEFMEKGGFPEVQKFGSIMLQGIYRDIIENDIISQHRLRNQQGVRDLAKYLISNIGREVSFHRLKSSLDISDDHTIAKYTSFISDAYLIFLLERFSYKLREQFKAPKKVYCIDTGIANSVSFRLSREPGRLLENMVFLELLRRKSFAGSLQEMYYWKDHHGREVDFVIKNGPSVEQLVQVTYASGEQEIEGRETKALITASSELRCDNLLTVTWDYEGSVSIGGKNIRFIPVWKWLLTAR